jgi:hypothetical protein
MAARYREKRTSITTVRDQYLSFATFPTPLIFHYPLPLTYAYRYPDLGLISDIYKELQAKHKQFSTDAVGDDKYRSGQRESPPFR